MAEEALLRTLSNKLCVLDFLRLFWASASRPGCNCQREGTRTILCLYQRTPLEILIDLTAHHTFHIRGFAKREVRRHTPMPDLRRWECLVERIRPVERSDVLRVGGRNDAATARLAILYMASHALCCGPAIVGRGWLGGLGGRRTPATHACG